MIESHLNEQKLIMTEKINWQSLIEKFTKNTCTKEEFDQLLKLVEQNHDNAGLTEELRKHWEMAGSENENSAINWEEKFSLLLKEARREEAPVIPLYINKRKTRSIKWAAVASILLLFSVGGYFVLNNKKDTPVDIFKTAESPGQQANDVTPGGNKAILTLADGSTINLDSAKNGTLTRQGNIKIIKGEDGQLLYHVDQENSAIAGYNTISTPRGGKYEIVLSDGTKVWLNASSSLKFPASFNGKIRDVTLTGEGYFEVFKNASMPFHVKVNDMTVEVLGTHFNVNAYNDESSISTTLLEGSVNIKKAVSANSGSQTIVLVPGEQSNLTKEGILKINHHPDMEEVVAWKDDNFEFNNTAIPAIMRQVSRWYDIEVDYKGSIPERRFTGKISRNVNLSQLIEMLQYTGLNMKIENKKIIIWKN